MIRKANFPLTIKQIENDDDNDNFIIEGLAAVYGNVDSDNEIIKQGAFAKSLSNKLNMPPLLWQHDQSQPIGVPKILGETTEGLFFKAELPKDDVFVGGRIIPQIKVGAINSFSVGFKLRKSHKENGIRIIDEADLMEISLVTIPANDKAVISGFKASSKFEDFPLAPLDREWDATDSRERVRKFTDSVDAPSAEYKKAFFYYDPENEDEFGGYKFPFVDIIDGKMMAVPRAVNNASARLSQSNLSANDQADVRTNIDKYRDKIEREREEEDEDKSKKTLNVKRKTLTIGESIYDFKALNEISHKDLKNALMSGIPFTREAANFIASSVMKEVADEEVVDEEIEENLENFSDLMLEIRTLKKHISYLNQKARA